MRLFRRILDSMDVFTHTAGLVDTVINPGGNITIRGLQPGEQAAAVRIANSVLGRHRAKYISDHGRDGFVTFDVPRHKAGRVKDALRKNGLI